MMIAGSTGGARPILSVSDATKRFGGVVAVDAVSFDIPEGAIVSMVGPNGAGKTTLFNLLSGVYRCDRGRIVFADEDVTTVAPERRAAMGLARTFQNVRLFAHLTALENVMVGGYCRSLPREAIASRGTTKTAQFRQHAEELLDWVGAASSKDLMPSELSYGDQRRVEIARALATRPRLLILDEPTAGMIADEARQVIDLMDRLRERGITLLLIEHNMNVVRAVSQKIVVLNFGRKIAEGDPVEVMRNPEVISAYLGSEE